MNKVCFIIVLTWLAFNQLCAQISVSGFIKDTETNEVLIGAYVLKDDKSQGVISNNYGFYSIIVEPGDSLLFSFIGYQSKSIRVDSKNDTTINVRLKPGFEINEVNVEAVRHTPFNVSKLSVKQIKQIPSLGATPDVFKAMQTLPGIQGQSEASSMLVVRGGDPGQNLYLLDNTPLIYVNHIGGFMSVFNPDMINDIAVYKGGFPAGYGGKLSSIVPISQRCGDTTKLKGAFGFGLTDVNLTLEGRLSKKATFIFTGRKTLYDYLMYLASSVVDGNSSKVMYGFHDLNGKVSWALNDKSNLYLNFYQGDDYFNARSKDDDEFYNSSGKSHLKNVWGNWLLSANYTRVLSARLFSETGISYTRYRLKEVQKLTGTDEGDYENKFTSTVQDLSLRSSWNYRMLPKWNLKFGLQESLLYNTPYSMQKSGIESENTSRSVLSNQAALFAENILEPFNWLEMNLGVRPVLYSIQNYTKLFFEPRVNVTFKLTPEHRLNFSYMQVNQTSHLLFASGNSIMANEIWIPATKIIKPSFSEQWSAGWQSDLFNNSWSLAVDAYYKDMENLATYKEGYFNIKDNEDWEEVIETGGTGTSYGLEFLCKKNFGKITGTLGYTYSQTSRRFENINNGNTYWYEYDRPHSISLNLFWHINKDWDFSALWVYQTGLPYTPAIGRYYVPEPDSYDDEGNLVYEEVFVYGERNSARMAAYHRLDIGFNHTKTNAKGRKVIWTFSVYNLYNRHNANTYYYAADNSNEGIYVPNESNEEYKVLDMYQVSYFPIIPSISYKLYFNKGDNQKPVKSRLRNLFFY